MTLLLEQKCCQVRRTKISERMRKLQDLVPNMDKASGNEKEQSNRKVFLARALSLIMKWESWHSLSFHAANQHGRHVGFGCRLREGTPGTGEGMPHQSHFLILIAQIKMFDSLKKVPLCVLFLLPRHSHPTGPGAHAQMGSSNQTKYDPKPPVYSDVEVRETLD